MSEAYPLPNLLEFAFFFNRLVPVNLPTLTKQV